MGRNISVHLPAPSESDIDKFRALYLRRFGFELSRQDAFELGIRLLHFVYLLSHPPRCAETERLFASRRKGRNLGKS